MKQLLLIYIAFFSISCLAQTQDTIFYNSKWKVSSKKEAAFYRPLPLKQKDSLFEVKDYYINNVLQMKGYSTNKEKDIFNGIVTWYNENGNIQYSRTYKNGIQDGEESSYFKDGTLQSKGIIKQRQYWQGTFPTTGNNRYKVQEYHQGSRVAKYSYYKNTKTIAEKSNIEGYDQVTSAIFYEEQGAKISEVSYKNRSGMYLELREGTVQYFAYDTDNFVTHIIGTGVIFEEDNLKKIKTTLLNYPTEVIGTYKDGYPHNGFFYKKYGQLSQLKNGKKEGEEICCFNQNRIKAKGIYKNNQPYNGTFLSSFKEHKLSTYKNGTLDGEQLVYDANFNLQTKEIYKNGQKEGEFITKNKYTSETYSCYYKNNQPFNGEVYGYASLTTYLNGITTRTLSYDYSSGKPTNLVVYDPNNSYQIAYMEFYKDDKTYKLYYKNGAPFKGQRLEPFGFTTWENGAYNGPYEVVEKNYKETGAYKNYKKEGEIIFKINGNTYVCEYRENKPYNGTNYDALKKEITNYKKGKRDGFYSKTIQKYALYDSISGQYKNDKPLGTFNHFVKGKKVSSGTYKNEMPYEGIFFNNRSYQQYANGLLTEEVLYKYYNKYKTQKVYQKGKIVSETTTGLLDEKESTSYTVTFKNEKPFTGVRFIADTIKTTYYTTPYQLGKKEGLETQYQYPFKKIISEKNYKKGKLEGLSTYHFKDNIYTATFKKNQPISGAYITFIKDYTCVIRIDNKNKQSKKCYGIYKNDAITSGIYLDNKPNNGLFLEEHGAEIYAKEFTNGVLTKTYINPYFSTKISATEVAHSNLTDTISHYKNKIIINYTNAKKVSGTAVFIDAYGTNYRTISFKNKKVTETNTNLRENKEFENQQLTFKNKKLVNSIDLKELLLEIEIPQKINEPFWMFFYDIRKYMSLRPYTVKFYEKSTQKELASVFLKNGKPYQGKTLNFNTETSENGVKNYYVTTYNNGKEISKKTMTLKEYKTKFLKE